MEKNGFDAALLARHPALQPLFAGHSAERESAGHALRPLSASQGAVYRRGAWWSRLGTRSKGQKLAKLCVQTVPSPARLRIVLLK